MKTLILALTLAACAASPDTATTTADLQCYPCDPDDPVSLVDVAHGAAGGAAAINWVGAPSSWTCHAYPATGRATTATCTVYVPVGEPGCMWGTATCTAYDGGSTCSAQCTW